jgi:pyruvate dehydrogenase E2 component (dihydrolipoamide acetyltransferase)
MSRIKEFNLPDLGEGLTEGEILKWLVSVGDVIELNQPIVEVETAKAAVEIPAKWAGQVQAIFHPEGATVDVGSPLIAIDTEPGSEPAPPTPSRTSPVAEQVPEPSAAALEAVELAPSGGPVEPGLIGGPAPGGRTAVLVGYGPRATTAKRRPRKTIPSPATDRGAVVTSEPPPTAPAPPAAVAVAPPLRDHRSGNGADILAKPPVRKLAKDLGVDLTTIVGSGPLGSVTREDVHRAAAGAAPAAEPVSMSEPVAAAFGPDRERRIPIKGVRKLTAENMVKSAFTAPHVTEFLTVDVTRSMKALDRLRALPEWREVRISPLLLIAKAVLLAVGRHPFVNSTWSGDEIVVKDYVNLGIAAATERGLIVPNIKDAGRLSLRGLADAMTTLVQAAKSGRTAPSDMSGGTFTITNVGVFGVDTGTPILPPGESAILAFGAVREMPWVHKGKIRVRQVTTLALGFDHRIIDGELGSMFLRDVGDFLVDPETTLLAWT